MKTAARLVALAAVCLALVLTGRIVDECHIRAASASCKEFTVVMAESSESRSPYPLKHVRMEAHRADGSRVQGELSSAESMLPVRRTVLLVPERVRVEVHDALRINSTTYGNRSAVLPTPVSDPQCGLSQLSPSIRPTLLGEAEVAGLKTVVIQTTTQLESGEVLVRKDWRAPDLDCVVLKLSEDRQDSAGTVTGHFEIEPVKVTAGTPAPGLFEIPADYVEKSPSEMRNAIVQKFGDAGLPTHDKIQQRLEREDSAYFANHRAFGK
jgi:hypothetical protein